MNIKVFLGCMINNLRSQVELKFSPTPLECPPVTVQHMPHKVKYSHGGKNRDHALASDIFKPH